MTITYWEVALRLLLAVLLGGLVGFERESRNRPAGFRTHILVCVGSALIMLVSAYGFPPDLIAGYAIDPGRIAAQVVTGVGFLGAGTIIRHRGSIRGLTTAASIWVVSGIGLAMGIGFYAGALLGTLLVLLSLFVLGRIERALLSHRRLKHLWLRAVDQPGLMGRVAALLGDFRISIRKIDLSSPEYVTTLQTEVIAMDFLLVVPAGLETGQLFQRLSCLKGILEISWQGHKIAPAKPSADENISS